jgi:exopolysaccharide biosynthesis polyprenyl glycosylphosphotransferase
MNVKKHWGELFPALVLLSDTLMLWVISHAAWLFWFGLLAMSKVRQPVAPQLKLWVVLIFICALALIGSYRRVGKQPRSEQTLDLFKAAMYGLISVMVLAFISKGHQYSRGFIISYFLMAPVILVLVRALLYGLNTLMMSEGWGVKKAMIAGSGRSAKAILDHLAANHTLGYSIIGFLVEKKEDLNFSYCGVKAIGLFTNCVQALGDHQIEEVFIPDLSRHLADYSHIVEHCRQRGIEVRIVSHRTDLLAKVAGIYDMAGFSLFRGHSKIFRGSYRAFKRIIDIAGSGLGLIALSPLFAFASVMIKADSRGPVFFKQCRVGEGGKQFKLFKFRTMHEGAEKIKHHLRDRNEADGPIFKIKNDPRITRVGRWLRRASLDELPQLINVFRGEMSLVGPRPPLPSEVLQYKEWHKRRLDGPQGMTGLWQVSGRSELSFEEMVLLDIYYLEHSSPVMDMEILFKTIPAVILGGGAY